MPAQGNALRTGAGNALGTGAGNALGTGAGNALGTGGLFRPFRAISLWLDHVPVPFPHRTQGVALG
jgi:hypothetical protein